MKTAFVTSTPLTSTTFYAKTHAQSLTRNKSLPSCNSFSVKPCTSSQIIKAVADLPKTEKITDETTQVSESFSNNIMHTYARYPIAISHGEGSCLYDLDGKEYIDCVAGIATCTLGHAHPAVVEAVTRQIKRTAHVSNLYYIPEQATLAEWLIRNCPCDKVFFCNSGAEANEAAIKLARKNWYLKKPEYSNDPNKKPVIITAEQSFHGRTIATLTATGQPKYHKYWGPLVEGFEYVRYNDIDHLNELCQTLGDSLAGILLEPIQGEGGVRPASNEFLQTARQLCDKHNALLMFDEVQVGMGRTGTIWAFEQNNVKPDAFTLAKGLGGGVPIGAMLCQSHCNVFQPGDHASTFGGNPLATSAGAAVARELTDGGVLENVNKRSSQLEAGLQKIMQDMPDKIKEIRGKGLIRGVELNEELKAADVVQRASERGLLLVPAGLSVVRFVPPLIISEAEIEKVLTIFKESL